MRRLNSWWSSGRRALHYLEIGEDAAGSESAHDFAEQRALPVVFEVMDREAGHDGVLGWQWGKRGGEIV
jgi:hypothetical protein